jgi:hypothetical protein
LCTSGRIDRHNHTPLLLFQQVYVDGVHSWGSRHNSRSGISRLVLLLYRDRKGKEGGNRWHSVVVHGLGERKNGRQASPPVIQGQKGKGGKGKVHGY